MTLVTLMAALVVILAVLLLAAHLWTRNKAAEAERLVPQAGQLVSVTGGTIHYRTFGPEDARPIVMIHGLSGVMQHCTYSLAPELEGEFRLIVIDRPGCGYSTRTEVHHGQLTEQARMIWEALDKLGVERPLLVGHSLGGAVSLAMALHRLKDTAGLALLCPATAVQSDVPDMFKALEIRTNWVRRLMGQTIAVPAAVATRDKVLGAVSSPEPVPEGFMIRAGGQLGYRPSAFVTASEDLLGYEATMPALAARYDELDMPRGILFGEKDAVLDPATHGRAMEKFGFLYEELPGLGHMFPLSKPVETAAFIRRIAAQVN
ncbi:MAG: alpha/beta fold hydrolase [Paracoccaceae bacterium]